MDDLTDIINIEAGERAREPKELRYRKLHFPDADSLVFNTSRKGFVPLPILLRKLIRHLSAPEFRVLTYLHLRAGKYGLCYPTHQEMAFELGLHGTKNLIPYIKALEEKKLISTKAVVGRTFYLVHDPRVGLQFLVDSGVIPKEELDAINELCIDLKQQPMSASTGAAMQVSQASTSVIVPPENRAIRDELL